MKNLEAKLTKKRRSLLKNVAIVFVVAGVVVAVKKAHSLGYIQALSDAKLVVENHEAIVESAATVAKAVAK